MLGIPVLEVATGSVFVYLLFSLLVSAVNEAVLGHLVHLRCHVLEDSLKALLSGQGSKAAPIVQLLQTLGRILTSVGRAFMKGRSASPSASNTVADRLLQHPMVTGLAVGTSKCPNYLPSNAFAHAMIGILLDAAGGSLGTETATLQAGIKNVNDAYAKKLLESLLTDAKSFEDARERLETWFNHSMDRVSGIYKRHIQAWLYVWAAVVVLFLNLDTIELVRRLWTDSEFRTVLVNNANRFAGSTDTNLINNTALGAAGQTDTNPPALSAGQIMEQINQVKLPIGWGAYTNRSNFVGGLLVNHVFLHLAPSATTNAFLVSGILSGAAPCPETEQDWGLKLLGLLITVGAISQGAPFWFDVLNKVTNLRAGGAPPGTNKGKRETPPA